MDDFSMHRRENEVDSTGGGVLGERESEGHSGGADGTSAAASAAGNRWPQDETLALLNIRLEMDAAFRDAGIKAPLWDEVSRRLAQLGYNRSAAKCKEKFENLYKYHKRTKQNRMARSNAKTYRFFDQLEALDHQEFTLPCPFTERVNANNTLRTWASTPAYLTPENAARAIQSPRSNSLQNLACNLDVSTSSSSGDEYEGSRKRKRKRKWQEFFGRILKIVLEKQEDLHIKFLEALDRCEVERIAREDAWKTQELARIKREQELLEQERLIAATKDAAVIAFLQKISEEGKSFTDQGKSLVNVQKNPSGEEKSMGDEDNGDTNRLHDNSVQSGSSRWPKQEVEALIRIRTDMENKCQGDGPKGLWEEISASMKKLGYDRNAKRCKEKWENINKYYRRVKDSNKKRPIDSKTCSYFQQLEALHHIKAQKAENTSDNSLRPEELLMHMMNHHRDQELEQQQQQLRSLTPLEQGRSMMGHEASENADRIRDDGDDDYDDEDYEEAEDQIGPNDTSARSIMA